MGAYKLLAATENLYIAVITELQHLDKFLRRVKWLHHSNCFRFETTSSNIHMDIENPTKSINN